MPPERPPVVAPEPVCLDHPRVRYHAAVGNADTSLVLGNHHLRFTSGKALDHLPVELWRRQGLRVHRRRPLGRAQIARCRFVARRAHRQHQLAGPSIDRQGHRFRRGPCNREIAGRDRQPQPMPRPEGLGHMFERHRRGIDLARNQLFRRFVAVTMGQVQQAIADPRRRPVRGHVNQTRRDLRHRTIHGKGQLKRRIPGNFQCLGQRLGLKYQRSRIVAPLIHRLIARLGIGTPFPARKPGIQRRPDRQHPAALTAQNPIRAQRVRNARHVRRGPRWFLHPAPVAMGVISRRCCVILHVEPQLRFLHDPGLAPLEPLVPPAQLLRRPVNRRAGHADMRVFMRPRPDQPLFRPLQRLHQPEHGAAIAIRPAAHRVNRHLDTRDILTDRPVFPEFIAALMFKPVLQPKPRAFQPLHPHVAPFIAHQIRVRRQRVDREHVRRP